MIRKAEYMDVEAIAATYSELLIHEQQHGSNSNWKLGVYPTIAVPRRNVPAGTMYVLEEAGEICASMIVNHEQAPEYAHVRWAYPAADQHVLVLHTLCVPPTKAGNGYGRQMVAFAKEHALKEGCRVIRLDTYAHNEPAKKLYLKQGFRIAGYGKIKLQGLIDEEQVYLECPLSSISGNPLRHPIGKMCQNP